MVALADLTPRGAEPHEALILAAELIDLGHSAANALALAAPRHGQYARLAHHVGRTYDGGSPLRYDWDAPEWYARASADGLITPELLRSAAKDALECPACRGTGLVSCDCRRAPDCSHAPTDCGDCGTHGRLVLPVCPVWVTPEYGIMTAQIASWSLRVWLEHPYDSIAIECASIAVLGGERRASSGVRRVTELRGFGEAIEATERRAMLHAAIEIEDWIDRWGGSYARGIARAEE